MDDVGSTTLQPLSSTTVQLDTIPVTDEYTEEDFAFLDDVVFFYGVNASYSDEELLQLGVLWCQVMSDGMTADDVIGRINEGASDNNDARLHLAVVMSGGENLCKDQFAKVEEIALRSYP
jgi:hypothetical protein